MSNTVCTLSEQTSQVLMCRLFDWNKRSKPVAPVLKHVREATPRREGCHSGGQCGEASRGEVPITYDSDPSDGCSVPECRDATLAREEEDALWQGRAVFV